MSQFPSASEIEEYTQPNITPERQKAIEDKYPGAYIAKNGIGLIFGYDGD